MSTSTTSGGVSVVAAICLLSACGGPASEMGTTSAACEASGNLSYVCGPANAEDIVQLGDSRWLILSGMSRDDVSAHLYLLDHETKRYEEWFPGTAPALALDRSLFAGCPGPLDTTNFSAHGLALRAQPNGGYRLYMTSHGAREAIEIFNVDTATERPGITWVGCVVLPAHISSNSVAILADGGFMTTKIRDALDEEASRAAMMAGRVSGEVYEWHPGGAVTAVAGTELSGPNGIELSPDQRYLFVAALGAREVVRYDRSTTPPIKATVGIGVRPDNLRWSADGRLWTVGGNYVPPNECASPSCSTGWSVYAIDPMTLAAERVTGADENAALQGASTALAVGNEIWIGTFRGDRVGYLARR